MYVYIDNFIRIFTRKFFMDLQEVLDKLDEAIEEKNWDLVHEVKEQLIELNLDNPFDGYVGEDWG
tara:strand:- start:15 stop:209 length:195 start_codon:yes stop_codon:yes gene_type:complete